MKPRRAAANALRLIERGDDRYGPVPLILCGKKPLVERSDPVGVDCRGTAKPEGARGADQFDPPFGIEPRDAFEKTQRGGVVAELRLEAQVPLSPMRSCHANDLGGAEG